MGETMEFDPEGNRRLHALARAREIARKLDDEFHRTLNPYHGEDAEELIALALKAHAAEQTAMVERLRGALEGLFAIAEHIAGELVVVPGQDSMTDAHVGQLAAALEQAREALASIPATLRARAGAERRVIDAARGVLAAQLDARHGALQVLEDRLRELDEAQP